MAPRVALLLTPASHMHTSLREQADQLKDHLSRYREHYKEIPEEQIETLTI